MGWICEKQILCGYAASIGSHFKYLATHGYYERFHNTAKAKGPCELATRPVAHCQRRSLLSHLAASAWETYAHLSHGRCGKLWYVKSMVPAMSISLPTEEIDEIHGAAPFSILFTQTFIFGGKQYSTMMTTGNEANYQLVA